MGNNQQTPRDRALAEVDRNAQTVEKWETEKSEAEAELTALQERAGEDVIADESAAARVSKGMQQLRDRIDIAGRAVAAAQPKLDDARRAVVLAEAAEWDAEAAKRRMALDKHVARIDELLEQLREHDGVEYGLVVEDADLIPAGASRVINIPKRNQLQTKVLQAEMTAHVLREVAAGRDPEPEMRAAASIVNGELYGRPIRDYYTQTVGAEGVLPAPVYARVSEAV